MVPIKNHNDFALILCAALRYSLGRRTYITSAVSEFINSYKKYVDKQSLQNYIRDIEKEQDLGDDCDRQNWLTLLKELKTEVQKRENNTRINK